jgi:hypothetical protein
MNAVASLSLRQERDGAVNAALEALPSDNCVLSGFASVEENVNGHGEAEVPHADIHSAVPASVVGHFIHENRKSTGKHTHPLHSLKTERFARRDLTLVKGKGSFRLTVPFLPSGANPRQTVVGLPTLNMTRLARRGD